MKHLLYIFTLLLITSCASRKVVFADKVNDAELQIQQQLFNRYKSEFMKSDSSAIIVRDLGWAERVLTDAKIPECDIPPVFKLVEGTSDVFSVQSPCVDINSEEYLSAVVFAEHVQLDSALINAKIKGVDAIYMQLMDDYADYMRKARFSCLCVMKAKKKYIVNATVFIPRKKFVIDEEALKENLNKLSLESDD